MNTTSTATASHTDRVSATGTRERMIAEAAYYRAEHRGFQGGDPIKDWLEAEAEIDRLLGSARRHQEWLRDRSTLQERLEQQLRQLDATLQTYKAVARRARGKARSEMDQALAALNDLEAKARHKLRELHECGEGAWTDLHVGAERVWSELRQAVEAARSCFGR